MIFYLFIKNRYLMATAIDIPPKMDITQKFEIHSKWGIYYAYVFKIKPDCRNDYRILIRA